MTWYPRHQHRLESCPVCFGSGQVTDAKKHILRMCVVCRGDGTVRSKVNNPHKFGYRGKIGK